MYCLMCYVCVGVLLLVWCLFLMRVMLKNMRMNMVEGSCNCQILHCGTNMSYICLTEKKT